MALLKWKSTARLSTDLELSLFAAFAVLFESYLVDQEETDSLDKSIALEADP